jgi:YfiH family protein
MFDMTPMILPAPARSFAWRETPGGLALVSAALHPYADHLFTTRGWVLGTADGDRESDGWRQIADALDIPEGDLIRVHQVHGRDVVVAARQIPHARADVIVNDDPALAIAVQSADCTALLAVDPRTGAVGAAHAGWRGLAARVPSAMVDALTERFESRAGDLMVAIGPSIGACCYEVGADVRDAFGAAAFSDAQLARWFQSEPSRAAVNPPMARLSRERRAGHWFFDGWTAVREQLEAAGVEPDRIFMAGLCTASHDGLFCSYRRDGAPAGRMAAVIRPRARRP